MVKMLFRHNLAPVLEHQCTHTCAKLQGHLLVRHLVRFQQKLHGAAWLRYGVRIHLQGHCGAHGSRTNESGCSEIKRSLRLF